MQEAGREELGRVFLGFLEHYVTGDSNISKGHLGACSASQRQRGDVTLLLLVDLGTKRAQCL